jgi:uracil-DNA glycosylase
MTGPLARALADFRANPAAEAWRRLPFFTEGAADDIASALDARIAAGAHILPAPDDIFNGLLLTPLETVKVVILGQDPYPTPGDAHGLAFSYRGTRRLPPSLKTILKEMAEDCAVPLPQTGELTAWARQGVLLSNMSLTVEAGNSGAHMKLGWSALSDEVLAAVSAQRPAVAFLLWGGPARKRAVLIDQEKHLVLECGHPSPLNRLNDFRGTWPFTRANDWLVSRGMSPIDWRL